MSATQTTVTVAQLQEELAKAQAVQAEFARLNAQLQAQITTSAKGEAVLKYAARVFEPGDGKRIPMVEFSGTCKPKQISMNLCRAIVANVEGIKAFLEKQDKTPAPVTVPAVAPKTTF